MHLACWTEEVVWMVASVLYITQGDKGEGLYKADSMSNPRFKQTKKHFWHIFENPEAFRELVRICYR